MRTTLKKGTRGSANGNGSLDRPRASVLARAHRAPRASAPGRGPARAPAGPVSAFPLPRPAQPAEAPRQVRRVADRARARRGGRTRRRRQALLRLQRRRGARALARGRRGGQGPRRRPGGRPARDGHRDRLRPARRRVGDRLALGHRHAAARRSQEGHRHAPVLPARPRRGHPWLRWPLGLDGEDQRGLRLLRPARHALDGEGADGRPDQLHDHGQLQGVHRAS